MKYALICLTGLLAATANALQYDFMSRHDRFSVDVTHGQVLFNGQRVSDKPFAYIEPLFDTELLDDCSPDALRKKPDLTIIRHADKQAATPFASKRLIYFNRQMISDGKHCATVTGQEFYLLPLNRDWFTKTNERMSIPVGDSLVVQVNDKVLVSAVKTDGNWHSKDSSLTVNWDYFSNFIGTLKNFSVDFRAHPAAGQSDSKFVVKTSGRTYVFEKVGDKTWAVQMPGSSWLVASGDFGLFGNSMDATLWTSPYSSSLQTIQDDHASADSRITALNTLTADALAAARPMLAKILDNQSEPIELREDIVARFRQSPSMANMRVLVQALNPNADAQFLNAITEALRIRNPKGPVIYSADDTNQIQAKIHEWQKWQAH